MARRAAAALALVIGLFGSGAALAQISASVGVASDFRFRGVSLSGSRPVATASVAFDQASGIYGGASVIGEDRSGPKLLGHVEYVGFATSRGQGGPSFDVGISNESLSLYADRRYALDYAELYAGVTSHHVSAHIHYSPDYYRSGGGAGYAEIDGVMQPADRWRLIGHVGATLPLDGAGRSPRYDFRAAIARQFRRFELQAAVTATTPAPPALAPQSRTALVLSANYFF